MKSIRYLVVALLCIGCTEEKVSSFYVCATTDLHGEMGESMASLYASVQKAKERYGDSLLLVDCGDILQGSPEIYYSTHIDTLENPIYATILNSMGYDAMALGNHDYEAGRKQYERFYSYIEAPILCANIVHRVSRKPVFKPYTIVRKGGLKIALLGMVSTNAIEWLPDQLLGDVRLVSLEESSRRWVKIIKRRENPDVIIGLYHTGSDPKDIDSAYDVMQRVAGISLICCGHTHANNIDYVVNPEANVVTLFSTDGLARHLAFTKVECNKKERFIRCTDTHIETMSEVEPSEAYFELVAPFMEKVTNYLDVPISYVDSTINSSDAVNGPCAWTDMLHHAYRAMSERMGYMDNRAINGTIVSPSTENITLEKGAITLRDFIRIYPYENTLSIVEMTGDELTRYLEFVYHLQLDYNDSPLYFFDSASGINYTVDRSQPFGSRVNVLGESNGNGIYQKQIYRFAMNTFRASGGNGFLTRGLGWGPSMIKARTIAVSDYSIRDMLLSIYAATSLDISPLNEWRFL